MIANEKACLKILEGTRESWRNSSKITNSLMQVLHPHATIFELNGKEDYITAKSEVGEKLLDPDGTIGSDIIRLGKDLANLKRQQEVSDPLFQRSSALFTSKPDI